MYGKLLSSRSTTLKRGLCALMRLYSSSSASVSEFVTVTSIALICDTSACTFGSHVAGGEVAADPVLETARLADVQQLLAGAEHAVHARTPRQCGDVFLRIEHAQPVASMNLAAAATGSPARSQARATTAVNIAAVRRRVAVL